MSEHVLIRCDKCQRPLRVRRDYLGQKVGCKYCGHQFVAAEQSATGSASTASQGPTLSLQDQEEFQRLSKELQRLNSERDELATALERSNEQRDSLQLRIDDLEARIHQPLEQLRTLQDELATSQCRLSELESVQAEAEILRDRASQVSRLEQVLQESQEQIRRLDATLTESGQHSLALEEELGGRQTEAFDLEQSRRELVGQVSALEEQIRSLQSEKQQHRSELDEALRQNAHLTHEFEALATGLAETGRNEVSRLEEQVADLQAALKDQTHANEEKLTGLVGELAEMTRDRDRLAAERSEVDDGLKAARAEIEQLGQGLAEVTRESARLEAEREAVARQRTEVQSRIKDREYELNEQLAELATTRERIEFEQSSLKTRWDREREEGLAQMERLAVQLAATRSERDELSVALQSMQRELATYRNHRDRTAEAGLPSEGQPHQPGPVDRVSFEQVNRENQDLSHEVERLKLELDESRGQLSTVRDRFDEVLRDYNRLFVQHQDLEDRTRETTAHDRAEIDRLRFELAEAEGQSRFDESWTAQLTQQINTSSPDERSLPTGQNSINSLPPRPQPNPNESQHRYRAALKEWMVQAENQQNQSKANIALIEQELQLAKEQLVLLHRDLALNDWEEDLLDFP